MMDRKYWYILGFAVIAVICVGALGLVDSDFGGSDDQGSEIIEELNPDYEPWWDGIFGDWEIPSETASLLFALQAAIGAVIIGFCIGRFSRERSKEQ
ncbi:MAG: cobalt transport protein CbiN [Candidatus Methanoplasma sp.]|jgi:cobalt transport protein|nr:cobalt transport protein CbiN [Candidatus Methanoplasma sp.]